MCHTYGVLVSWWGGIFIVLRILSNTLCAGVIVNVLFSGPCYVHKSIFVSSRAHVLRVCNLVHNPSEKVL